MNKAWLIYSLIFWGSIWAVIAQPETNIWYFGIHAGLDFSSGTPVPLQGGAINTVEGCATMSNANGELLFYTDGIKIWNRNHQIMQNGSDLMGHISSSQSGIIVPKPKSKNFYYVFTVDVAEGDKGLRYSIVDINQDNGLGAVIEKNVALITPTDEKVTAVKHKNGQDIWIITHKWDSDAYYAFLLTQNGVQNQPTISNVGTVHGDKSDNGIGTMKVSPDGKKLAAAIKGLHIFELFDFDNSTGKLSNPIKFQMEDGALTYGLEFSSDGSKLYGSAGGTHKVYQFDLRANSPEAIQKSVKLIGTNKQWTGSLQLGPDGKIYVTTYGSKFLGVINKPNQLGIDCDYVVYGINLGGATAQLGLPTFVQNYFEDSEYLSKISTIGGKKIKIGEVFTKNILFEFDKYVVRPEYFKELDDLVAYLKAVESVKINITGHTDSEGTDEKNLTLSNNRAKAVADYLISKGINKTRITYKGFGESQPVATNDTPEGRKLNRRIEFILTK